jgi:FtsP/CotA-like multicopper oxidase with cupredoxin domain
MTFKNRKEAIPMTKQVLLAIVVALMLTATAYAAAPGIKSTNGTAGTFSLSAEAAYVSQPDGNLIYSWGYGCATGSSPTYAPATTTTPFCSSMQVPGPTLIVTEGQSVSITLTDNLPLSAGNTSILFPGIQLTGTTGGVVGLLTQEAAPGNPVTYTFTAPSPGTRTYYSGTQSDLQVEMGLYGVVIVLPKTVPANCTSGLAAANLLVEAAHGESDFRLAAAATDHPESCYDREYLFQFAEMDPNIHRQAELQVQSAAAACTSGAGSAGCSLNVPTEPYHPTYFLINGRSMPDDMDSNYAFQYPHQPYNGNPHVHAGEQLLLRIVGQGRWQHPFHEHANHVRILARDANMILTPDGLALAGPALFTTTTTPGLAMDGIFYFTGRGLNWDMYGHNAADASGTTAHPTCVPDANGYYTALSSPPAPYGAINYYEWCQDHLKPLQVAPFGDVGSGGPMTLPDANILTNGAWYSGSPYLGPDATGRAVGPTGTTPPSGTVANSPSSEAGFSYMWHSHNEREITTNNIFPGGMMMMLLVDSREFLIDESN